MTASQVAKLVAMLIQAYPQAQVAPATSGLYERELADLDVKAAGDAVQRLIRTSKWLPTISEIRSMATDVARGPRRLGAEAWGDVLEAIRRIGSYNAPPEFTDPLVAEAVRLSGWRNLCLGDNDAADRARFIELYDGLEERTRADQVAGLTLQAPNAIGRLPWRNAVPRALPSPEPKRLTVEQAKILFDMDQAELTK